MQLFPDERDTIVGLIEPLRRGETTCLNLVERCLERVDEWEPRVRAWVSIDRAGAREQARSLDAEGAAGRWRGPLHGMPLGIKDIVDWAGLPTAAGSKLRAQSVVSGDAFLLRKLRDSGAILLGKTVTTQFASFDPPPTRNPWNLDRTPGGSSSGSAAATATGMCLGAIGSQTGGSITRPAAYCGVAGCKPTYGRVSLSGVAPLAPSMDHPGPIARCVADLAIILSTIAGHDPAEPHSLSEMGASSLELPDLMNRSLAAPKLRRLRGFFEDEASNDMRVAFDGALKSLADAGAHIADARLPRSFDEIHRQHRRIMCYEAAGVHRAAFRESREDFLPRIAELVEEGIALSASDYAAAKSHQRQAVAEVEALFEGADVAVCPAAPGAAPDASTTGNPVFNSPWSYVGLPTASFPIALDSDGLPLSIQLVGRRLDEGRLFAAALWCERVIQNMDVNRRP